MHNRRSGTFTTVVLPCLLLMGAMFNLTLVVAGLKEYIIDDLGGEVSDATLFFSVETIAYILFAPVWGLLSDRIGRRKPFVFVGFLGSAVLYAVYGVLHSVSLLLLLRFVQGGLSVMGWSAVMALVLDHPRENRSGRYMGLMGGALILGVALGAPVGGYVSSWYGARAPLQAAAVLFSLLALGGLALAEGSHLQARVGVRKILGTLSSRPRLLLPLSFYFVDRFAVGLFVVVFPLYLDSLGADDPIVRGRYLSLFLLPFALLQYFTGRLAERWGPYPSLLLGSALYGVVLCCVGFSGLYALWPTMIALGVLASVMFPPTILLTAMLSDPISRGSAMGGFNLAGSLGFALGPLMGGWAYAVWGFGSAFLLSGLLEVVCAAVGAVLILHWHRRNPLC